MKVRTGFVSNSSSSSFSIFGVCLSEERILAGFKAKEEKPEIIRNNACSHEFDRTTMKFCPECGRQAFIEEQRRQRIDIGDLAESLGWSAYSGTEYGEWLIGLSLGSSKRKKIEDRIQELHEVLNKCRDMFGVDADFISGEYPS